MNFLLFHCDIWNKFIINILCTCAISHFLLEFNFNLIKIFYILILNCYYSKINNFPKKNILE